MHFSGSQSCVISQCIRHWALFAQSSRVKYSCEKVPRSGFCEAAKREGSWKHFFPTPQKRITIWERNTQIKNKWFVALKIKFLSVLQNHKVFKLEGAWDTMQGQLHAVQPPLWCHH